MGACGSVVAPSLTSGTVSALFCTNLLFLLRKRFLLNMLFFLGCRMNFVSCTSKSVFAKAHQRLVPCWIAVHHSVLHDTSGPEQALQLSILSEVGVACNEENLMTVAYWWLLPNSCLWICYRKKPPPPSPPNCLAVAQMSWRTETAAVATSPQHGHRDRNTKGHCTSMKGSFGENYPSSCPLNALGACGCQDQEGLQGCHLVPWDRVGQSIVGRSGAWSCWTEILVGVPNLGNGSLASVIYQPEKKGLICSREATTFWMCPLLFTKKAHPLWRRVFRYSVCCALGWLSLWPKAHW